MGRKLATVGLTALMALAPALDSGCVSSRPVYDQQGQYRGQRIQPDGGKATAMLGRLMGGPLGWALAAAGGAMNQTGVPIVEPQENNYVPVSQDAPKNGGIEIIAHGQNDKIDLVRTSAGARVWVHLAGEELNREASLKLYCNGKIIYQFRANNDLVEIPGRGIDLPGRYRMDLTIAGNIADQANLEVAP